MIWEGKKIRTRRTGLAAPIFHHQYALSTCVMGRDTAAGFASGTSLMFTKDQGCPSPAHQQLRRCNPSHHICTGGHHITAGWTLLPLGTEQGQCLVLEQRAPPAATPPELRTHAWPCPRHPHRQRTSGWSSAGWWEKKPQESRAFLSRWSHMWGRSTSQQRGFSSKAECFKTDTLESTSHTSSCLCAEHDREHMAHPQAVVLYRLGFFVGLFSVVCVCF